MSKNTDIDKGRFNSYVRTMCALLFFTLDAGLLARSQYSGDPATGHLDIGFSWFHCD